MRDAPLQTRALRSVAKQKMGLLRTLSFRKVKRGAQGVKPMPFL